MGGTKDGWMEEMKEGKKNGWEDEEWMDGWMEGREGGMKDGWMDGLTDGRKK